jgi:hypothetical protein
MQIVVEKPPIYDDIAAVFSTIETAKPIFAWGSIIYNPWAHQLGEELIAHEEMHGVRQTSWSPHVGFGIKQDEPKIRQWWRDYLASPSFRLEEEIPAHRAEYRQLLRMHGNTMPKRKRWLLHVARRLRNPLYQYNHLVTLEQAKTWIELDDTEMKGE